jgi:hypothetical protein
MHLARLARLDDEADAHPVAFADQVMMHARGREERRDRRELGIHASVRHDEEAMAVGDGLARLAAELGHGAREPDRTVGDREEHGDGGGLEARQVHVADPRQLLVVQDRGLELELPAGVGRRLEEIALGADRRRDLRHQLLADAVERRIRDLGEELLEVVVEQPRPVRQHGERGIGAHGAHGLLAVHRHGPEEDAQILVRVAEGELALEHRLVVGFRDRGRLGQALDRLEIRLQPLAVGMLRRVRVLQLRVVDDAALRGVDEEDASGMEALLEQDALGRDVEDADLGGHHDHPVLRDVVARGAQPVSVEHGADHGAVGERDGRGPVPGLHEAAVVLVERPPLFFHGLVPAPRLGNHHQHGQGQGPTRHHEELEHVVEDGGVAAALDHDGQDPLEVVAEEARAAEGLARPHPVDIAPQRVDLAVVGDVAIRMRERPGRERVGREALVDQGQCGLDERVRHVREHGLDLVGGQHALVDEGIGGEARDVEVLPLREVAAADDVLGPLPDHVELALEGASVGHGRARARSRPAP